MAPTSSPPRVSRGVLQTVRQPARSAAAECGAKTGSDSIPWTMMPPLRCPWKHHWFPALSSRQSDFHFWTLTFPHRPRQEAQEGVCQGVVRQDAQERQEHGGGYPDHRQRECVQGPPVARLLPDVKASTSRK